MINKHIVLASASPRRRELLESFVVNFPKSESVINNMPSASVGEGGTVSVVDATVTGSLNLRNVIIIMALILLAIEWIIYIRG